MLKVEQGDIDLAECIMSNVRGYAVKLPSEKHWLIQMVADHREDTALPLREVVQRIVDGDIDVSGTAIILGNDAVDVLLKAYRALHPDTKGGE